MGQFASITRLHRVGIMLRVSYVFAALSGLIGVSSEMASSIEALDFDLKNMASESEWGNRRSCWSSSFLCPMFTRDVLRRTLLLFVVTFAQLFTFERFRPLFNESWQRNYQCFGC